MSFGFATILNPPININGTDYSLLIRFWNHPSLHSDSDLVTGQVFSVEDLSGGYRKVICARGTRYFSQTHVLGYGNSWEELVPYLSGGNVCITPEPARGPGCYADPNSHTGPDSAHRAQIGDVFLWNNQGFLITKALPFQEAPPEGINWQNESLNRIQLLTVGLIYPEDYKWFAFDLSSGAKTIKIGETSGLFDDGNIAWEDTGVEQGQMVKKTWESSEDYYPVDACLGFGEFFPDLIKKRLVFPSTNVKRESDNKYWCDVDRLLITYYEYNLSGYDLTPSTAFVFEGAGSGLSHEEDHFSGAFAEIERPEPFSAHSQSLMVGKVEGAGGLMWRKDLSSGSPFFAWDYNESGILVLRYRLEPDGMIYSSGAGTFPPVVTLKLEESAAGEMKAWYNAGAGWILHDTISLDLTYRFFGGAWGAEDAGFRGVFTSSYTVSVMSIGEADNGILSIRKDEVEYTPYQNKWYWEIQRPWSSAIFSVYNFDTQQEFTQVESGLDLKRNTYMDFDGKLVFAMEAFGDRLRITYEGEDSSSPPGRNPGGVKNFGEGGTDPNQNIGNWRDALIIYDPEDEMQAVNGSEFSVRRNAGFDPRETFNIYFDIQNDGTHTWTLIPDENCIKKPLMNFVLVEKSWVDANIDLSKQYCFQGRGKKFFQLNSVSPRYFNELEKCIQVMNTCEIHPQRGEGAHICGEGQMYPVPTTRFCDEEDNNVWGGWAVGITGSHVNREKTNAYFQKRNGTRLYQAHSYFGNRIPTGGIVYPNGWMEICGTPEQGDLYYTLGGVCQTYKDFYGQCPGLLINGLVSGGALNPILGWCADGYCGEPDDASPWYEGDRGIANAMATFFAWASTGAQNYCGCNYYESWAVGHEEIAPAFNFTPTFFQPSPILKRMPRGTIINSAYMEFKLSGAWRRVRNKEWNSGVVMNDIDGIGESFSFSLMKMKKDSRNYDPPCSYDPKPPYQSEFAMVGQGGVIGGAINQQEVSGVIDCTGMIQALVDDHDSGYGYYFLFPSQGTGLVLGENQFSFLRGLLPDSYGAMGANYLYFSNMVMQYWSALSVNKIIINFTLPSGIEEKIVIEYHGNALEEKS